MTPKTISITLDQTYSNKIRVIQEAISDPTTHKMIVEGLVDTGYTNALKTLYSEGVITDLALEQGIRQLPDYLHYYFDR